MKTELSFENKNIPVSCIRDGYIFGSFTDIVREENPDYQGSTVIRCLSCGNEFTRHEYHGGVIIDGNQCGCQDYDK